MTIVSFKLIILNLSRIAYSLWKMISTMTFHLPKMHHQNQWRLHKFVMKMNKLNKLIKVILKNKTRFKIMKKYTMNWVKMKMLLNMTEMPTGVQWIKIKVTQKKNRYIKIHRRIHIQWLIEWIIKDLYMAYLPNQLEETWKRR